MLVYYTMLFDELDQSESSFTNEPVLTARLHWFVLEFIQVLKDWKTEMIRDFFKAELYCVF